MKNRPFHHQPSIALNEIKLRSEYTDTLQLTFTLQTVYSLESLRVNKTHITLASQPV